MPFIPHTQDDIRLMLETIGLSSTDQLFAEIPPSLQHSDWSRLAPAVNEMSLQRQMQDRAKQDEIRLNFTGAGAYEHHIPAVVWEIASRGEWMTAYTPYQAEASQGTLQLLYEYQSMMAHLMAMPVSNASLYDGASSLAEAILMAIRCQSNSNIRRVLIPRSVHPFYRQVIKTIVRVQHIEILEIPFDLGKGQTLVEQLSLYSDQQLAALVIPQPNFFGTLEAVDDLTDWAHQQGALVVGVVNPMSMALLKPPGQWGKQGADIVCGEGQPLGVPLASGGPYFGFLCCQKKLIRQLPGRLVGRTRDRNGKEGFTLTLQAREQHIRRSKATSNICTNQGLLVIAATLYLSLLGAEGLKQVAIASHTRTRQLLEALRAIPGITVVFDSPFFHEGVIHLPLPVKSVCAQLQAEGIEPGFSLTDHYPELGECFLVCATETKTAVDIQVFSAALQKILAKGVAC